MNINMTKLKEKFGDINNKTKLTNLGITSCNIFDSTKNIKSNTGFYSLLIIIVIFIIVFIIFYYKGFHLFENKFDEVIEMKFKEKEKDKKNNKMKEKILPPKHNKRKGQKGRNQKHLPKKSSSINSKNDIYNNESINNKKAKHITSNLEGKNNKDKKSDNHSFKPFTDYEFNWLSYEDALRYDKRTNCKYYASLLRSKQIFFFTFCSFNDYNSHIIKKFIFFLSFALHYAVNALFFNDSNLHQIYEDEGEYNFKYQIPYIIYSTIISTFVLRIILETLVLTDKDALQIKIQPNRDSAIKMKKKKLKCIKIKFSIFFVLNFILLVLLWYYLTCFNAIYRNTQIYLIENTFISFGFSLIYPLIINIIPVQIRMHSLHSKKDDLKYNYLVAKIIQII